MVNSGFKHQEIQEIIATYVGNNIEKFQEDRRCFTLVGKIFIGALKQQLRKYDLFVIFNQFIKEILFFFNKSFAAFSICLVGCLTVFMCLFTSLCLENSCKQFSISQLNFPFAFVFSLIVFREIISLILQYSTLKYNI